MKKLVVGSLCSMLAAGGLALTPQTAEACGGLFCDGGPNPMPVDQTGENVIFIPQANGLEVQIQIQYEGDAESFAWVIPVSSIPTGFKVGSQPMFDAVMNASVPNYGIQGQADDCSFGDDGGLTAGGSDADDGQGTGDPGAGESAGDGGPNVVLKDQPVGAFEITVLEGGDADKMVEWLNDNGYQQDEEAIPIFEEYLADDHAFLAIKLNGSAGIEEIHPIALEFDHVEPCVPLKLTRIAAVDDMEVRTYFLGQNRTVPQNYKHVLVNPLKIDWVNQGDNYREVIQKAVDADMANGRAWVTEYAGPSDIVPAGGLYNPSWSSAAFVGLDAIEAVQEFKDQGLLTCEYDWMTDADICQGNNPMVEPLLKQFVLPGGVEAQDFYFDPTPFVDLVDPEQYGDGQELADLLEERVIEPGRHAEDAIAASTYLTRMYTIISPHEMTEDPMFYANETLDDVAAARTATQRRLCNGDDLWILPDGREVYVPFGATWPDIGGDEYWEEEVDEMPDIGAPIVLVNNTAAINTQLAEYNLAAGWDGSMGNGGAESGDSDGPGQTEEGGSASGCGCRTDNPLPGAVWAFGFLAGFGFLARRRR